MKTLLALTGTISALILNPSTVSAQSDLKVAWELNEGVQAPESAYYDVTSKTLFLSQIWKRRRQEHGRRRLDHED